MPFLFVDYDQGAGGEYFCEHISKSPQCVPLTAEKTAQNRTKVNDIFEQEFLKVKSQPKILSSSKLYDVVPCHRKVEYASTILDNVRSIRIANPTDPLLINFLNVNRINKVLNSKFENDRHFFGELDELLRTSVSRDWIKHVKRDMTNGELLLLSKGITPTADNVKQLINTFSAQVFPEPTYNYDLIIPYEDLFFNTAKIEEQVGKVFGIEIVGDWLETYSTNYNAYLAKT